MFTQLQRTQRAYISLSNALQSMQAEKPERETIKAAIQRGYFLPEEDDFIWSMTSRYLTIRQGYWGIINDMAMHFAEDIKNITTLDDWRHFLLGYAASCQVVKMARLLVDDLARHKLVQRKINEGAPHLQIPRKVFTRIYRSLSDTDNAIKMQYMMNFVEENQDFIDTLADDEYIGDLVKSLPELEKTLHSSQLAFLKLRLKYLWHAVTRRGAVSKQKTTFFILEKAGRVLSEVGDHDNKRVTPDIQAQLKKILEPGDVIITRHDFVASNLFLPGYWPHAALYIGTQHECQSLDIELDPAIARRWQGDLCVLEAKSDGVLFRPLSETLAVDECVIIRPRLTQAERFAAISRIVKHEGKSYNFDFDFFRSDRLVCTEVVFRAFDGLGDIQFVLIERAGRLSLSAEDLLDMSVSKKGFDGFEDCKNRVVSDSGVTALVQASYGGNS